MEASFAHPARVRPRIIVHGGAGNITTDNLPPPLYRTYRDALLDVLNKANQLLSSPKASALDVAVHAVMLLEDNPLFNAGHGAVFTRAGTHELEASVMVSRGFRKRGVGVINVRKTKSPISLAKQVLLRGETDNGDGAQGHCQLQGETCDHLAESWGLELVNPSYFWTRKRWDEHRKGLGLSHDDATYEKHKGEADRAARDVSAGNLRSTTCEPDNGQWNGKDYLPQGTVGAVVLDWTGTLCVATSTGGLTNKLAGRVGDTPTIGAGFFAEQWTLQQSDPWTLDGRSPLSQLSNMLGGCLPFSLSYSPISQRAADEFSSPPTGTYTRAVAISGTGNGDSFLRTSAVRTATAIARFSAQPLQQAVTAVAGPNGILQKSAEDRWRKTGEGEGGMIGIDFNGRTGYGQIVADFNCGGMFHAFINDSGDGVFRVFSR